MSAQLASVAFKPRGTGGWTTGTLKFGRVSTLVLGRNGSGKTPILKGVAYCMGHPVELPPDIQTHCESIQLDFVGEAGPFQIERRIAKPFEVQITGKEIGSKTFLDEKTFTASFLQYLQIPHRELSGRDTGILPPYMSVLVPMFWVDQDLGWRYLYTPLSTHNFVRDQHEEVVRWLLGVPAKHKALDKTAFITAKQRYESILEQVEIRRNTVEALTRELGVDAHPDARIKLQNRRTSLLADLKTNASALDALVKSTASLDDKVSECTRVRDASKFALEATERRTQDLVRLGDELKAEVGILETNELAADAFRVLCGQETCQFFRRPEESYGRRLLYLKDQLKDFQTSFSVVELEIQTLRADLQHSERALAVALLSRQTNLSKTPSSQIAPTIDAITKELTEVNFRIERIEARDREEKRFEALVDATLRHEEEVNRLRPSAGGRSDQTRLNEVRETLTTSYNNWLKTLKTQNLPDKIWFDEDLRLCLGENRFTENSPYSGSTRTRIVLAYHAALLETSLRKHGNHPPFLLLDTPRQHELHDEDLSAFVRSFQEMAASIREPVQIVIAAFKEDFAAMDTESSKWRPAFGSPEKPRFFGVSGTEHL